MNVPRGSTQDGGRDNGKPTPCKCGEPRGARYGPQQLCWPCWSRAHAPLPVIEPSRNGHKPDRYHGRHIDLASLLAAPPRPVPWRVRDLVADGTVTVLSGASGSGKSWFAQALCIGVQRGEPVAGLACIPGNALYIDAEMGPQMFVDQRLRPAGIDAPEFDYIDAMGLDISKAGDLAWLHGKSVELDASLVVIDSLRRLAPSMAENDSDDMAPTVAAIAKLARDTGAAVVLVHHKGDSDKFYRGSTAIKDQTDALFALLRDDGDESDDSGIRRLRCRGGKGKMRYAVEPKDVYLEISPQDGGVAACDAPAPRPGRGIPARALVKRAILEALPAKTKTEVSVVVGRPINDRVFRESWAGLERDGAIVRNGANWQVVSHSDPRGELTDHPPESPVTTGDWEVVTGESADYLSDEAVTPEQQALAERLFDEYEEES